MTKRSALLRARSNISKKHHLEIKAPESNDIASNHNGNILARIKPTGPFQKTKRRPEAAREL